MTLVNLSKKYGKSSAYFSVLKRVSREKFDFIFSFDKDREKSVEKYIQYVESLRNKIGDFFINDLETIKDKKDFLMGNGLYHCTNEHLSVRSFELILFGFNDPLSTQLKIIRKLQKVERIIENMRAKRRENEGAARAA